MTTLILKLMTLSIMMISFMFLAITYFQYHHLKSLDHVKVMGFYRFQSGMSFVIHLFGFISLMIMEGFSKELLILYAGQAICLIIVDFIIEHLFSKSNLVIWGIIQFFVTIGFLMISRLSVSLGYRQLYFVAGGYAIGFLVAYTFKHVRFLKFFGIPSIVLAFTLLLMTNATINGATNWLEIGGFSFQPSEPSKILYCLFIAASFAYFKEKEKQVLIFTGLTTVGLVFIQVFQKDLGSALIFYIMFILMAYVFTTNRLYIIGGGFVTLIAGYLAYLEFSHVRTRIIAWLDPWSEIDGRGYQIAQSLFAISNGGLAGTGLHQGYPEKIPVVTTDFIYSAIFEEMGMIVALVIILLTIILLMAAVRSLMNVKDYFNFMMGTGLVIVLGFQSFLIIGGVTKTIPLTGVTLPFISYGGTSIITSFLMIAFLQGIALTTEGASEENHKDHHTRNKPLTRINLLFVVMFLAIIGNIIYFIGFQANDLIIDDYNPRLSDMESQIDRGDILTQDGTIIATNAYDGLGNHKRIYPFGTTYAHLTGDMSGFTVGLEAVSNEDLLRSNTNIFQKFMIDLTSQKYEGYNIRTTIDHDLQMKARELLGDNKGAIVAMDPTTGAILAMVSTPSFDPNTIAQDSSLIIENPDKPLLNRATQGLYIPGSTFKTVTTIAYLEHYDESEFFHYCLGEDIAANTLIHCYGSKSHGRLGLEEAFALSCNTSYAQIGLLLDKQRLLEISEQFLFNEEISFDLPVTASTFTLNSESTDEELVYASFGQIDALVTPLNNCLIASAIANKGTLKKPYLVDSVETDAGAIVEAAQPSDYRQILTESLAAKLTQYMMATNEYGTAKSMDQSQYLIASKTGTAEKDDGKEDNALYIGFAPADDPKIVLSVVIENVGSSTLNSVPVADELFALYLSK